MDTEKLLELAKNLDKKKKVRKRSSKGSKRFLNDSMF